MKTQSEIVYGLSGFNNGTSGYTRGSFGCLMTDGITWLAQNAECFWLVYAILSYQRDTRILSDSELKHFQFWTLKVDLKKKSAELILERDTDDVVLTQEIEYTDFPLETIKIYYSPEDKVMLLPSEY